MRFPHVLTVFNKGTSDGTPYYRKTIVSPCLFIQDENTARNRYGLVNADTIRVFVPITAVKSNEKTLVNPIEYSGSSEEEQEDTFCFAKGDFIALGDVGEDGMSPNELKNSTGNLFSLTGIAKYDFAGAIAHYELAAK